MKPLRNLCQRTVLIPLLLLAAMAWHGESIAAQLTSTWTDNSNNEDGFKIERKLGQTGTFAEVDRVPTNVTNYSDPVPVDGQEYCYRVRAYNSTGNSAYTNESCGQIATIVIPPTAPIQLTVAEDAPMIVDNTDTTGNNFFSAVGSWTSSTHAPGFFEPDYQYAAAGDGSKTATWTFEINKTGQYEVAANWTSSSNRALDAPYTIRNNGNILGVVPVDQRVNGGQSNSLGTFALDVGTLEVELTNAASNFVIADAVRVSLLQ